MNAETIPTEVRDFAHRVRTALDDLSADEVDDLTEGLEADLAESVEDADDGELGDPVAYAAEMRAAAGFAPRIRRSGRVSTASFVTWSIEGRDNLVNRAIATKVGAVVWPFLVAIRPLWWVLRGWAAYEIYTLWVLRDNWVELAPGNAVRWLLLIIAIVVSVQWGRGRWLGRRWLRGAKAAGTAIAIVALPFLIAAIPPASDVQYVETATDPLPGLSLNGQQIGNIFAYDSSGALLTGVQLFDQDGNPLRVASAGDSEVGYFPYYASDGLPRYAVPSDAVPGRDGWNVYPLREVAEGDVDFDTYPATVDGSKVTAPPAPFLRVQPLAETDAQEMIAPSPSPSPVPDSSPSPSATPSPSPSESDGAVPSPSPTP